MTLRISAACMIAGAMATAALTGCGDDGTIGSTLLEDEVQIIVDSAFTVTGESVPTGSVQPGTLVELIGNVNIPGYGSISSNVVAQFLPATSLDTANYSAADIDSAFINFRYYPGGFIGDSIVPMGLTVYELTRQLPSDVNTSFDPSGYYNPAKPLTSGIYSPSTLDNSTEAAQTTRTVALKLPLEFARNLFNTFIENPDNYINGQVFTRNVFPGIFATTTFGSGRLMQFERTSITFNMHKYAENTTTNKIDTTYAEHEYYAVSPEVINNNNIDVRLDPTLVRQIEEGTPMLIAPAGYNARLRFPAPEVMAAYRAHGGLMAVLNTVTLDIPADTISSNGLTGVPAYALLVLEKDLESFFTENKLPDGKTSFYSTYDTETRSYPFTALAPYINSLLEKENVTEEDYTFCLVPVNVTFEQDMTSYYSTYIVSEVTQFVEGPAVAVLDLSKAKVKLTYSKQIAL